MSRELDFFSTLRNRIEVKPSRDFDREFWRAFDNEFSTNRRWFENPLLKLSFAPVFTVFALATGVFVYRFENSLHEGEKLYAQNDFEEAQVAIENEKLLQNLDLYLSMDDVTSLTDSDWKVLLHGDDDEKS